MDGAQRAAIDMEAIAIVSFSFIVEVVSKSCRWILRGEVVDAVVEGEARSSAVVKVVKCLSADQVPTMAQTVQVWPFPRIP